MQSLTKTYSTIAERNRSPMPEWAFCDRCHLIKISLPGVWDMIAERVGPGRVDEAPACRCEENDAEKVRELFARSGIPHQRPDDWTRRFDNFEQREGTETAFGRAVDFTNNDRPSLFTLTGGTGTGKSHLAESICREYLARGVAVRYEFVPALLDRMRATFNDPDLRIEDVLAVCREARILVLDDLGLETGSDWTNERLTSIVEQRMARGAKTVVTTNKTRDGVVAKGYERLASRMWATGTNEATVAVLTPKTDARVSGVEPSNG